MKANAAGDWRVPQIACLRLNLARHGGKVLRRFFVEVHVFKKRAQSHHMAVFDRPLKYQLLRLDELGRRHFGRDAVAGVDGCVPLVLPQSWKLRGC
jgi:hypothetical protein